jgi:hypothetical protein
MKKLFVFIAFLFSLTCVTAQESQTWDYDMKYDGSWLTTGLSQRDTLGTTDSTWYYTVRSLSTCKRLAAYRLVLDRTGGTNNVVAITFRHKTWLNQAWTNADTVNWTGSTDTAFNVYLGTAVWGDYWQIHLKGANNTLRYTVDSLYFKVINDD